MLLTAMLEDSNTFALNTIIGTQVSADSNSIIFN